MAIAKEIRAKIHSVEKTKKITSAMELVAASKMRKARDRMEATRPYAEQIRRVIAHLAKAHPEYTNAFMQSREPKKVGYIVISTDRGLCGSLNVSAFRKVTSEIHRWHDQSIDVSLCTIGSKAETFFQAVGGDIVASASHLGDEPALEGVIGCVKVMMDAYAEGVLDRLFLVSSEFISTISQQPRVLQLLPICADSHDDLDYFWDYEYEPDAKELLDDLMTRYLESLVYQALMENLACEQASRMLAMRNASDNANEMIDRLNLAYNKARQAAITQELSEIVAGAAAVE